MQHHMEHILQHKGIVKDGEVVFYSPTLRKQELAVFENQEVIEIIEATIAENTSSQYGYYFAGIIRDSCMKHESFGGWSEREIDDFLREKFLTVITYKNFAGMLVKVVSIKKIEKLGAKRMAKYVEEVIAFLTQEGIPVKDPGNYLNRKYRSIKL